MALNLRDFGAVGDGITDDTAAWRRFITAPGTRRYVPGGTYIVGALDRMPPGVIYGDGPAVSTIVQPESSPHRVWGAIGPKAVLRDLTFHARPVLTQEHRISVFGENVVLDHVAVVGFAAGFGLCIESGARWVHLTRCHLLAGFWGLTITDARDVYVRDCLIQTTGVRGAIDIEPNTWCDGIRIEGNTIDGFGRAACGVSAWGAGHAGTVRIVGNTIRGCAVAIKEYACGHLRVVDNDIDATVARCYEQHVPGTWASLLWWSGNTRNGALTPAT